MSNSEFERKLRPLRYKKKQEEEIFHNKVYLFNTQTMENNIKKLKESLMQKTHFLQKHETIDNMQKATKYNLIRSSNQFNNERKNQKNNKYNNSSFSSDKNYEIYRNKSFINSNYNENDLENVNNINNNNNQIHDYENLYNYNRRNDYNYNYNNIKQIKENINKEIIIQDLKDSAEEEAKTTNNNSSNYNFNPASNQQKTNIKGYISNSPDKQADYSAEKESSIESFKNFTNKKPANARFLTSLDHTSPNNNNNDSYSQSTKNRLQKFSNKLTIKSRNKINATLIRGNSDSTILDNNNNNIDNNKISSKLNNFGSNYNSNKIQKYDFKDKINQSANTTNIEAEIKEAEHLRSRIAKKSKNEKLTSLSKQRSKHKSSFNFSKSDSDFKLQEGEKLNELDMLEKSHQQKYKNRDLENKSYFNDNNSANKTKNINYDNTEIEKNKAETFNNNSNINKDKDSSEEVKKQKNLNKNPVAKSKTNLTLTSSNKQSALNRNLKEIELTYTLNSLCENESRNEQQHFKLPVNNHQKTNSQLFSSTKYLLSNPNLITNTEINANLKSQIKFYNTQNNLRNFTAPQADADYANSKKNNDFKNSSSELKNQKNKNKNDIDIQEANKKNEKETNISLNLINNNNDNYFNSENDYRDYNFNKRNVDENSDLNNSQFLNNKNKNSGANKNKYLKRLNSNLTHFTQKAKVNRNASEENNKNLNSISFKKMKITDRVALMSKGILKESYDLESEKIFSKIFTKNLEQILEMKKYPIRAAAEEKVNLHDERHEFSRRNYISKEITDLKEKVYFLKGTLDYIFPQFLIGKLKETVNKQKVAKKRNSVSKITNRNYVNLHEAENGGFNNYDNIINDNYNYNIVNGNFQRQKTLEDSKSFTHIKENGIFIVENTDKCSSNGNSKNEFFFPNINLNTNQNNYNNNNTSNNNSNDISANNINNFNKIRSSKNNFAINNNLNNSNINFNNLMFSIEFNPKEKEANKKKEGKLIPSFKSSSFNNRNFLNPLNKTKLISPETNSSLFNKFNNFKNLGKNATASNSSNVFWNNSMNEINLHHQKKLIKKQILTKTLSIQNINSFNNNNL